MRSDPWPYCSLQTRFIFKPEIKGALKGRRTTMDHFRLMVAIYTKADAERDKADYVLNWGQSIFGKEQKKETMIHPTS